MLDRIISEAQWEASGSTLEEIRECGRRASVVNLSELSKYRVQNQLRN